MLKLTYFTISLVFMFKMLIDFDTFEPMSTNPLPIYWISVGLSTPQLAISKILPVSQLIFYTKPSFLTPKKLCLGRSSTISYWFWIVINLTSPFSWLNFHPMVSSSVTTSSKKVFSSIYYLKSLQSMINLSFGI